MTEISGPPRRNRPSRSNKRSRSGAKTLCPLCDKALRGKKGLKAHMDQSHSEVT